MNSSSHGNTMLHGPRDTHIVAVLKNVTVVALGIIINYINGLLIHTLRRHQIFYVNPRYVLFIHLVVNDVIQLTTTITLFVLSFVFHKINTAVCCTIIMLAVFTTLNTPMNLAVMAVECYIAICLPLRHAQLCTLKKTYILIGSIWVMSTVTTLPNVFVTLATEPVQLFYSRIFCERDNLFRHPVLREKRNIIYIVYLIGVWLTLLYTYIKIFLAAKQVEDANITRGDTKKARNTILLHGFQLLLCMLTYVAHIINKGLYKWFPQHYLNVLFVSYVIVQILPRFVSPIVYGLRDKTLRQHLKNYVMRHK